MAVVPCVIWAGGPCVWNEWKDQRAKILILNQTLTRPSTGTAGEIVQLGKKRKILCYTWRRFKENKIKRLLFAAMVQWGSHLKKYIHILHSAGRRKQCERDLH